MTIFKHRRRWQAQVYANGERIDTQTFDTKHEAVKWKAETLARQNGTTEIYKTRTFDDLAEEYRKCVLSITKPNTRLAAEADLTRRIIPFFHYRKVQSITQHDYECFVAYLRTLDLAHKSQTNCLGNLASMFKKAEQWGWITRRPNAGLKFPRPIAIDYKWWERVTDIDHFLETARQTYPTYYPAFRLAVETGMRVGEICGLERGDIDFERGQIRITKQWLDKQQTTGPTKNSEIRTLSIFGNPELLATLKQAVRSSTHIQAIFTTSTGKRLRSGELAKRFQNCLRKAQMPRIRFHDLRHTYASHYLIQGGEIWQLKALLGHKSIQMTERYSHHARGAAIATSILQNPPASLPDHCRISYETAQPIVFRRQKTGGGSRT